MSQVLEVGKLPEVIAPNQPFEGRPMAHESEHRWGPKIPAKEQLAEWRVGYQATIALIDLQLDSVLDGLEECDLRKDTLVIFTSDRSDMMGDHGVMTKGAYFYDACTRGPMIVYNPDAAGPPRHH